MGMTISRRKNYKQRRRGAAPPAMLSQSTVALRCMHLQLAPPAAMTNSTTLCHVDVCLCEKRLNKKKTQKVCFCLFFGLLFLLLSSCLPGCLLPCCLCAASAGHARITPTHRYTGKSRLLVPAQDILSLRASYNNEPPPFLCHTQ